MKKVIILLIVFMIFQVNISNTQPMIDFQCHDVGNTWLTVTNFGVLGNPGRNFMPEYPSYEYPADSDIDYLFQGAIWVGAIVGDSTASDTIVSVGIDGWLNSSEEFMPGESIGDTILIEAQVSD